MPAPQLERGAHALVAERRRQPHVDDRQVGVGGVDGLEQRRAVGDRGRDVDPAVAQQALEPVAQQGEILGYDDAHGSDARTTVGPPAGL